MTKTFPKKNSTHALGLVKETCWLFSEKLIWLFGGGKCCILTDGNTGVFVWWVWWKPDSKPEPCFHVCWTTFKKKISAFLDLPSGFYYMGYCCMVIALSLCTLYLCSVLTQSKVFQGLEAQFHLYGLWQWFDWFITVDWLRAFIIYCLLCCFPRSSPLSGDKGHFTRSFHPSVFHY